MKIKQISQYLFCWTSTVVEDVTTHKKEIAISYQILGIPFKTRYKAI